VYSQCTPPVDFETPNFIPNFRHVFHRSQSAIYWSSSSLVWVKLCLGPSFTSFSSNFKNKWLLYTSFHLFISFPELLFPSVVIVVRHASRPKSRSNSLLFSSGNQLLLERRKILNRLIWFYRNFLWLFNFIISVVKLYFSFLKSIIFAEIK
jgi:hypothetical protein